MGRHPRRAFAAVLEWLDVAVALGLLGFGIVLVVILAAGGGSAIEIALVVVLALAMPFGWFYTSGAHTKLRQVRRDRKLARSGRLR